MVHYDFNCIRHYAAKPEPYTTPSRQIVLPDKFRGAVTKDKEPSNSEIVTQDNAQVLCEQKLTGSDIDNSLI